MGSSGSFKISGFRVQAFAVLASGIRLRLVGLGFCVSFKTPNFKNPEPPTLCPNPITPKPKLHGFNNGNGHVRGQRKSGKLGVRSSDMPFLLMYMLI